MQRLLGILFFSAICAHGIGYQHGTFASQSTQGAQWRGTSSIIAEHYSITVNPSYLDIELDWEFDCNGGQAPDSFRNALEIVGNLNLVQNAAVTGMLLWNGDEILKAKLKPILLAREEYEKVVDRNAPAPPRPRDPVIFEYGWGKDNYDISIFPVTWQGSRKLRMRYVVEAINLNGRTEIPFPTAFSPGIATYSMITGPGVSSIEITDNNGSREPVASPAEFDANDEIYHRAVTVHPAVDNAKGKSVFYTASVNLENWNGSLTHVVGRTGAQVLAMANIREDIVILWRWNHPEFIRFYAKQIVRQAETLKQFLTGLTGSNKRAALVVDIPGEEKTVFNLGGKGSASYSRMLDFVDSLSSLEYTDSRQPFNPGFSVRQIDSMVTLAQEEFDSAIRRAMALFDDDEGLTIRRILLLTAGPQWITKMNYQFTFQADSGVEITTFALFAGSASSTGFIIPAEALGFYWPGIPFGSIRQNAFPLDIQAVLATESGQTITVPVAASATSPRYSWNMRSPHLDKKLHTVAALKPLITWNIISNGASIAEITEEPAVVRMSDAIEFGSALAGTECLESVDGALPTSLASTFGFVDRSFALLALEEDVMDPLDQERYRISGVPPLTNADIVRQPDENVPPEKNTEASLTGNTEKYLSEKKTMTTLSVKFHQSMLRISFDRPEIVSAQRATVGIYTLSGRLLMVYKNQKIVNGILQLSLPDAIRFSKQALLVTIRIGSITHTRTIAVQ